MKSHMDTYSAYCNCEVCRPLMGALCHGCRVRHREVIKLTKALKIILLETSYDIGDTKSLGKAIRKCNKIAKQALEELGYI